MNNSVIFAAAGNGKTYGICVKAIESLKEYKKEILILTYTNEGKSSIEKEYRKQNCGVIHERVIIKTWYSFIMSELIKPYQCLLKLKFKRYKEELDINVSENLINSIAFYQDKDNNRMFNSKHIQYYLNNNYDIRKDYASALAHKCIIDSQKKVIARLENIYDYIFIDELQDYAGWDLEIIKELFESKINIYCVGDNKQATYRTNNSLKNKQYRDDKIIDFFIELQKLNKCTISYSNTTRRFNGEICKYINLIYDDEKSNVIPDEELNIKIENSGVYIIEEEFIEKYCKYYNPVILRYDVRTNINFTQSCNIFNYGASKGDTFERVIIIPVTTVKPFILNNKDISSKQTKSKFYVACTRARHSVVFLINNFKNNGLFESVNLSFGEYTIPAFKFIG